MKIRNISLMNYRNYDQLNIELGKDVNVFQGENAQGKTNILEAIYYCAFGRSHRTVKSKDLILWKQSIAQIKVYIEKDQLQLFSALVSLHLKFLPLNSTPRFP